MINNKTNLNLLQFYCYGLLLREKLRMINVSPPRFILADPALVFCTTTSYNKDYIDGLVENAIYITIFNTWFAIQFYYNFISAICWIWVFD